MTYLVQILSAAVGSLFFAMLFNVRGNRLIPAAVGGALSWGIYLLGSCFIESDAVCIYLASVLVTLYAEAFARILRTPATLFVVSATIPMIPGGNLYQAMYFAVLKEYASFFKMGLYTLVIALAIALGILSAMSLLHGIVRIKKKLA